MMNRALIAAALVSALGYCARAQDPTNATKDPVQNHQALNQMPAVSSEDYVHKLGAGITVGEPTGVSLKYWLNQNVALDFAGGWSFYDHADAEVQADVLWHKFHLLPLPQGRLPVYFGVGALGRFRHSGWDDQAGIRIPVGVSYMFENLPLDVFAEVGPAIIFTPDVRGQVTGGVGIRYWF